MMEWLLVVIPAVASGIFGGAVATYLKTRPAMKEQELKGEEALWTEIKALRTEAKADRKACDERVERMEARHAQDMETLKAEHSRALESMEAEIRVLRHDRNNLRAGFNAMLAMLKRPDANVPEVIAAIEEMVARGDQAIALEKGALPGRMAR